MQNITSVKASALRYRFLTKEIIIFIILIAISIALTVMFNYVKISHVLIYSYIALFFILIIGTILSYFLSLLEYKNLQYSIEDNSISLRTGIFAIDTETIPFEKIKNSSFRQTVLQRLFGVGDITIDQDDEQFVWSSIDNATAKSIMEAVSSRSNIQPISIAVQPPKQPQII